MVIHHVGKLANTDTKVAVVFTEIPGDAASGIAPDFEHALVVQTDTLPDAYAQGLESALLSKEGQNSKELGELLARRQFYDGSNILSKLMSSGHLRKVPVDQVVMYPTPASPMPLKQIKEHVRNIRSHGLEQAKQMADSQSVSHVMMTAQPEVVTNIVHQLNENAGNVEQQNAERGLYSPAIPLSEVNPMALEPTKFNVHQQNQTAQVAEIGSQQAKELLLQAQLMQSDLNKLLERAYILNPTLRPAPVVTNMEVAKKPRSTKVKTKRSRARKTA